MRKKEDWMFEGAIIQAHGRKAVIKKLTINNIKGQDYVYNPEIRFEGDKRNSVIHHSEMVELKVKEQLN